MVPIRMVSQPHLALMVMNAMMVTQQEQELQLVMTQVMAYSNHQTISPRLISALISALTLDRERAPKASQGKRNQV
jgi:hypothetical protein